MMLSQLVALTAVNLRMIVRDRILHAIVGVAMVMILLVPFLSSFSMRQTQELAITLSLSTISLVLLVVTLLLGASAVWRDVDRRYTASILTLPLSRSVFLLAKFAGIAIFLALCGAILGGVAAVIIPIAAAQYPSDLSLAWENIALAIASDILKYILLAGVAILLSAISTSFSLPFFGTLAIYLAGSASQEVFEYITGDFGQQTTPTAASAIKIVYYLLPNFAVFDFKVQAVYALKVSAESFLMPACYAVTYTGILLGLAIWVFSRRQLS